MATVEERIDESFAALAPLEQQTMTEARDMVAGLADDVKGVWADVEKQMHDAASVAGSAAYELQRLKTDVATNLATNPVAARAKMIEIAQRAPADLKARYDSAGAAIAELLPALLENRAMPSLEDPQQRNEAIMELQMLLAGKSGPALTLALAAIAGGSDRRLATLVAGSWGKARLVAGGVPLKDVDAQHHALRMQALQGTIKYGTPQEAAHARAFGKLNVLALRALVMARTRSARRLGGQLLV
jgi:hypothetical protein